MALFNWAEAYSVHVPDLDRQHHGLMDLINELHDGISTQKSKAILEPMLDRLVLLTASHFRSEEEYMRDSGYPALEEHRREHEALTQKLLSFQNDFRVGRIRMSLSLMEFLRGWLHHHVVGADHDYEPWVAEMVRRREEAKSLSSIVP